MTQGIEIRSFTLDAELLRKMDSGKRNQLLGCMHVHNELTFLNRLLLFSRNFVSKDELHDQAQLSQMWCVLQLLAGKLYESWVMIAQRFSLESPARQDAVIAALDEQHQTSLMWLRDYFSEKGASKRAIAIVRNKTAFHYDGLDNGPDGEESRARGNRVSHSAVSCQRPLLGRLRRRVPNNLC